MTSHPSNLSSRSFKRILLIKPSSLGDLVHALPVLHGLRQRYPEARIDWLAGSAFAPLIEGHPDIHEVVRFDRQRFGRMMVSPSALVAFHRFRKHLQRRNYDLVIDLQGLFRSGFLSWSTRAKVRIGFAQAREAAWMFYTDRIRPSPHDTHAVDRNYGVAAMLGFADLPIRFDLAVVPEERRRAEALLAKAGLTAPGRFAAVLPGARWETKRWPPERFSRLIDGLRTDLGLTTVLLAGRAEAALCEQVRADCREQPINLAGRTDLRELVAVLERAAVVICHDSAPMHLAAALGRPMVSILGPTNPARTGPYTQAARIIQADLPCVPCYLRRLAQCRYDHQCMTSVEPPNVLDAVANALGTPAESGSANIGRG
ncbi:MAG: lipopolysaccharide heptosyltransferase I [Phycisphaerae bacterium]